MKRKSDTDDPDENCLHVAQGKIDFELEEIAIASNAVYPSGIALINATLSAHILRPYEIFSIFQPVNIGPLVMLIATPILKFEYGI